MFYRELQLRGLNYISQRVVPLSYKGIMLDADLRFDVLVEELVVTELKAIEGILPIHEAIVLTYMRMLENPRALSSIFTAPIFLKKGRKL
jgi:GxxExxY protein